MKDLDLDGSLQPIWSGTKNYQVTEGKETLQQIVRLKAIKKTYNISSEYQDSLIPQKIEKEIRNIARELDFIDSVADILVEREENSYSVDIQLQSNDEFNIDLDSV